VTPAVVVEDGHRQLSDDADELGWAYAHEGEPTKRLAGSTGADL
jgi:hypothetical protein